MRQKLLKIAILQVKLVAIAMVLLLPALLIVTAKAEKFYMELWKELGITQQEGKAKLKDGFIYGFLYEGGFRNIRNIILGDKEAVAKDLLEYTRTYVYGSGFKNDYAKYREASKPVLSMVAPSEPAVRKRYIEGVRLQMRAIKAEIKNTDGELKKLYEEQFELLERQILDFSDPKSKTIEFIMQNEASRFNKATNYYCEQYTKWEIDFPQDPMLFIKNKLHKFLDETAAVDYEAKLVKIEGTNYFEKRDYNYKPNSWKYAYQAGPELTGTVRAFVKTWVSELNNVQKV